eukprot:NODE_984_length_2663_cov_4.813486.p1 GENE.NODE_984_length_2663_cov_4.813486~~NODE_984_length_2663_cov_4.813486.p1  ORF type:complete len:593 (-),score=162.23 NODE_984_length_2663_cov_4.813486:811-2589(-)
MGGIWCSCLKAENDSDTSSEGEPETDDEATTLSYVGEAVYSSLRYKYRSTHNDCWNITHGRVVGALHQSPASHFWGKPSAQILPVNDHADFLPQRMFDVLVRANHWVDVTSLSPPEGKFLAKFQEAMGMLAERAERNKQQLTVRMLFGNIIGMPVDCDAVLQSLMASVPDDCEYFRFWVGAWRKGVSWNHSKIIAVDGKYLFNGGHNLWDAHYLQNNPVHDISMEAEGQITQDGHLFANEMWRYIERIQRTCVGQCEAKLPDWLPIVQDFRISVSQFPEELGEFPPQYQRRPEAPRRPGDITMIAIGRHGLLHNWSGLYGNGANPSDAAIAAMLGSAKQIIRMSLQDLGPLCMPFPGKAMSIPGGVWPAAYLREVGIAIYDRGVDVEIALSPPHCVPGSLNPATVNYGNGWTCVDVAAEIIKAIIEERPDADAARFRQMVRDNLRLCYLRSRALAGGSTPLGNHAKHFIVDDQAYYLGSQNLYICNLAEWGIIVDDVEQTRKVLGEYWGPMWASTFAPDQDVDVDKVMDNLKVDRTGVDPSHATPEEKEAMMRAQRMSYRFSAKSKHHEADVDEVLRHHDVEDHIAEMYHAH